ncbi:hypothetical protein ACX3YC_13760 [Pseudomonas mohnii]|uniref:hypothetical protein n=1 Tax=Pseudomonas mohnii TaxID=395600 RepID=UPI0018DBFD1B|nr:hypothetical protein [Pseudomonas mohnii]MBH8611188.1 hypothetical protein [Pseudomonas mohnii]
MAHSLHYHIGESVHAIEAEVERLLDVVDSLKVAGDEDLASVVLAQVQRLLEAVIVLRVAIAARSGGVG